MRLLNIVVIAVLILAASFVYKIKFDSTLQAERVGKVAGEIRRERDAVAALRAEWGKLAAPNRIEELAKRHLKLQPVRPTQFDSLANLPARPLPPDVPATSSPDTTGSVPAQPEAR